MPQFPRLKSCFASLLCSSMVFTSVPLPAQSPSTPSAKDPRQSYQSDQLSA